MDELGLQDPGAEHQFTMGLTITLPTSLASDGLSLGTAGEICPWRWQQATFWPNLETFNLQGVACTSGPCLQGLSIFCCAMSNGSCPGDFWGSHQSRCLWGGGKPAVL